MPGQRSQRRTVDEPGYGLESITGIVALGGGQHPARPRRCLGLQGIRISPALLQAHQRRVRRGTRGSRWQSPEATKSTHRFQNSTGSRCPKVATGRTFGRRSTNVGQAIQRAMREIEKANPDTLYGIFGDVQWTNKERLSGRVLRSNLHRSLSARWASATPQFRVTSSATPTST